MMNRRTGNNEKAHYLMQPLACEVKANSLGVSPGEVHRNSACLDTPCTCPASADAVMLAFATPSGPLNFALNLSVPLKGATLK
ncbi:hypothetical protein BM477_02845 [Boudabousia marimammalium]|uniref:Uncharacterized protein n=1 Tax=Boudabousia marimammalium TaxID=156892 RepID=A0A1Q5PRZ7_9ACTO|nr:hypothetical protein BM477_02845 [Boudabousia marimammalium]